MSSSTQNGGGAAMVPAGAVSSSSGNSSSSSSSDNQQISRIPTYACFQHATKVAILEDKPIILDYWTSSLEKSCLIGVRSNNEKLLVKSEDEYTSPIAKIFNKKPYICYSDSDYPSESSISNDVYHSKLQ